MSTANGRSLKGQFGSASVKKIGTNGDRLIDLEGMKFQVGKVAAEELCIALQSSLRGEPAGPSILMKITEELDAVLDRLTAGEPAEDGRDPGRAEAFTTTLALIRNPYAPDYSGEKRRQMDRCQKRNAEE